MKKKEMDFVIVRYLRGLEKNISMIGKERA
jgi:hypothetical protein